VLGLFIDQDDEVNMWKNWYMRSKEDVDPSLVHLDGTNGQMTQKLKFFWKKVMEELVQTSLY
jgi:hypothetical protein